MKKKIFARKQSCEILGIILSLANLGMVGSSLVPNSLIFSDDILVNIQLVTFLLLSNIS